MGAHRPVRPNPPPPAAVRERRWFHGTSSEAAGQGILRDGLLPREASGAKGGKYTRGHMAPQRGRIYLTHDIGFAQIYALGTTVEVARADNWADAWWGPKNRYGYLFVVDGADVLADIEPDEDCLGYGVYLAHMVRTRPELVYRMVQASDWPELARSIANDDDLVTLFAGLGEEYMTPKQLRDTHNGEYAAWASGGKRMIRHLHERAKLRMIEAGAAVALLGPVRPREAWRLDKSRAPELKRDGSTFFRVAEDVSDRLDHGPSRRPNPPATPAVCAATYYHGTDREDLARRIAAEGIQPRDVTLVADPKSRTMLAPVAGRVYVTPEVRYGQIYALGGVFAGYSPQGTNGTLPATYWRGNGRYGYLFEVPGADLCDVEPDEDLVGEAMARSLAPMRPEVSEHDDHPRLTRALMADANKRAELAWLARKVATPRQLSGMRDGFTSSMATAGKRALRSKLMSPELRLWLVESGASLSHRGPLRPTRAWRVDKQWASRLRRDGSNFFAVAEDVTAELGLLARRPNGDGPDTGVENGYPFVVVPAGTTLFHGSLEPFDGPLRPGGDGVLWFADSPKIAQLYLPMSGGSQIFPASALCYPTESEELRNLQQRIGIDYDLSRVTWDRMGRANSFPLPEGWSDLPTEADVRERMATAGWPSDGRSYRVRFHDGLPLLPGEAAMGRLFVVRTTAPLRCWLKARGEGDLTDVQYNDLRGFRGAEAAGLDGVIIDDFAQSEEWGNFGHESLGVFSGSARKLSTESVPARYREWERGSEGTPEWPDPPPTFLHDLASRR